MKCKEQAKRESERSNGSIDLEDEFGFSAALVRKESDAVFNEFGDPGFDSPQVQRKSSDQSFQTNEVFTILLND